MASHHTGNKARGAARIDQKRLTGRVGRWAKFGLIRTWGAGLARVAH